MIKHISDIEKQVKASGKKKVLVLACAHDEHALEAVDNAIKEGIVNAILVGKADEINKIAKEQKLSLTGAEIIDSQTDLDAVNKSVALIKDGKADILMKGKVITATLLKAVLNKDAGLVKRKLLSHLSIIEMPGYHKIFGITDVAINIAPNIDEKIAIVENAAIYMNALGIKEPKVAFITAVETVNQKMPMTIEAAILSKMSERRQIKNCIIDGPLSLDLALRKDSVDQKGIISSVAGDADILLFPDIEAGNVFYKSLPFIIGSKYASFVVGAKCPIILTSRADSEDVKHNSIVVAAAYQA